MVFEKTSIKKNVYQLQTCLQVLSPPARHRKTGFVDTATQQFFVRIPLCYYQVLEKWVGADGVGASQFDSIDMTNKHGEEKVMFKVHLHIMIYVYIHQSINLINMICNDIQNM